MAEDIRTNVMPSLRQSVCERWVKVFSNSNPRFNKKTFREACEVPTEVKRKVVSSEEIVTNFNEWNSIQNRYNVKCVDKNMKLPTGLIEAAIKEFESWCETYHVDHTQFKYIRACGGCVTWQVDFHDDLDATGPHVSVYDIYFNEQNPSIMQSCIVMGN